MRLDSDGRCEPRSMRAAAAAGRAAPVVAAAVALGGAGLLIAAAVPTAGARFSGSTETTGSLMRTAVVDLELGDGDEAAAAALAIDAENLVPGDAVTRCLTIVSRGSADAVDIRLLGRREGGSGLEDYLRTRVESGTGLDPRCGDFVAEALLIDAALGSLWSAHGTFAGGLPVLEDADEGSSVTVRVTLELVDDDRAQGRDTAFWLVIEARP